MNHRVGRVLFATAVGLSVAWFSYRWASDPAPRLERAAQERTVVAARAILASRLGISGIEVVDPLMPNRKAGKSYVYRSTDGWEVSGYYRRGDSDPWHPWLMRLTADVQLKMLRVQDRSPSIVERAVGDPMLETGP